MAVAKADADKPQGCRQTVALLTTVAEMAMQDTVATVIAKLGRLQAQLEAAVAAQNWAQVAACDRTIAALLAQPVARLAQLQPVLANLRRCHEQALAAASAECERLADQLDHLTANREALLAYGQSLSEDT